MEKQWEIMTKSARKGRGERMESIEKHWEIMKKVPGREEGRGLESTVHVEGGFGSRVGWRGGGGRRRGEGEGVERYVHNNYMCCT